MDGNHLVVPCTLSDHDIKTETHAVVDCGCTGLSFMNVAFARQHNFPHYPLKNPKTVEVIDGRPISSGDIMEYVEVQCTIGDHHETLTAYLTSLGHYPLVLGIPWLKNHDVSRTDKHLLFGVIIGATGMWAVGVTILLFYLLGRK
jgi:hypothetical protein